jgi:hypothetical protein
MVSFEPQPVQNFAGAALAVPQFGHLRASERPQFWQNLAFAEFSKAQSRHCISSYSPIPGSRVSKR